LLVAALDAELEFEEQDEAAATYAEKIEAADRELLPGSAAQPSSNAPCAALAPHIGRVGRV